MDEAILISDDNGTDEINNGASDISFPSFDEILGIKPRSRLGKWFYLLGLSMTFIWLIVSLGSPVVIFGTTYNGDSTRPSETQMHAWRPKFSCGALSLKLQPARSSIHWSLSCPS